MIWLVRELPKIDLDGFFATIDNRLREVRIVGKDVLIFIPFEKLEEIYLKTSLPTEFIARRILEEKVI